MDKTTTTEAILFRGFPISGLRFPNVSENPLTAAGFETMNHRSRGEHVTPRLSRRTEDNGEHYKEMVCGR